MAAERVQVTEKCPECGDPISGWDRGPGSVAWKMGSHRARAHKVPGKTSAKRGAADDSARPVMTIVQDVAGEIPRGGKRPPTEEELARAFGRGLGIVSVTVASYAVETDPGIPDGPEGEQRRRELVDYLSLPSKSAVDVMRPVGKAVAGTGINARYGRTIVDNVDVVAALGELTKLGLHWRRYFRDRKASAPIDAASWPSGPPQAAHMQGSIDFTPGPGAGAPPVGNIGVVDVGFGPQSPPPEAGVLLTPGMLRSMGVRNEATMGIRDEG